MSLCFFLPWLIGIGSAILGGLIGWYLSKQRPIADLSIEQHPDYLRLTRKYQDTQNNLKTLQTDHGHLKLKNEEWQNKSNEYQSNFGLLQQQHNDFKVEYESYRSTIGDQIAEKDEFITNFSNEQEELRSQLNHTSGELAQAKIDYDNLESKFKPVILLSKMGNSICVEELNI